MRSSGDSTSVSSRTPRSIFSPEFLADLDARDDVLTATEAAYAGPWKTEAVRGKPGRVAVLRTWEQLETGDEPQAVFLHEEWATLFAALLPLVEREPIFHLGEEPTADGYPLRAVFGDEGSQIVGWLPRYDPGAVKALHLLAAVVSSPVALAAVMAAAGSGLGLAGRILGAGGAV
jgi:hypothetical protein